MPIEQKEVTFLGWLEDIFKFPTGIPEKTFAVVKTEYEDIYLFRVTSRAAVSKAEPVDLVTAFSEGAESVADIKGVNVKLNLTDLVKNPLKTLNALGKGTIGQIMDLDEVELDRRSEIVSRLTRGQVTDGYVDKYKDKGDHLAKPGNLLLRGLSGSGVFPFNSTFPIDPKTNRSKIQLVVDTTGGTDLNQRGDWEDTRTISEKENRFAQYKTYASLAGQLAGLAGNMESPGTREFYRNSAIVDYNRTVAREMGIDLEKVLNTQGPEIGKAKKEILGSLHTEIASGSHAIDHLLSDETRIAKALNIPLSRDPTRPRVTAWTEFSLQEKELLKSFLKQEELMLRLSNDESAVRFDFTPEEFIEKLNKKKLSPDLEGTEYEGDEKSKRIKRTYMLGDYEQRRTSYSLETYLKAEAYQKQIRKRIVEETRKRFNGQPPDVINKAISESLSRFSAASKAAEIANDLHAASVAKEILEVISSGKFIQAGLLNTRLFHLLPFVTGKIRTPTELAAVLKPARFQYILKKRPLKAPIVDNANKRIITEVHTPFSLAAKAIGDARGLAIFHLPNTLGINFASNTLKEGSWSEQKRKDRNKEIVNYNKVMKTSEPLVSAPTGTTIKEIINNTTGVFNSKSWVEWKGRDSSTGNLLRNSQFAWISSKDMQGLYGNNGVFTLFYEIENNGLGTGLPDAKSAFETLTQIDDRFNVYKQAALAHIDMINNGTPIPPALLQSHGTLFTLGLLEPKESVTTLTLDKIEFYDFIEGKALFDKHARKKLADLSDVKRFGKGRLYGKDRWDFLVRMFKNGKSGEFEKLYTGILNHYTRFANATRNYVYKNFIFGDKLTRLPLIGRIMTPVQGILRNIGMTDEVGLTQAIVNRILIFKALTAWGKIYGKLAAEQAVSPAVWARFSQIYRGGGFLARLGISTANKLMVKTWGKVALKSLALLLKTAGSLLSGGAAWVLTLFGGTIWKVAKNLLMLRPGAAIGAVKEDVTKLVGVIKKVAVYPIMLVLSPCFCGCLIIISIAIIGASMLVKLGTGGGFASGTGSQSDLITVDKTGTYDEVARSIDYTVTVNNISTQDVVISSFDDKMTFVASCTVGKSSNYGEITFPGSVDTIPPGDSINYLNSFSNLFRGKTIGAGESLSQSFTLEDTIPDGVYGDDGTYVNLITATAEGESGKSAYIASLVKINDGGCLQCPGGWPAKGGSFAVTQGPHSSGSEASHSAAEAADFAPTDRRDKIIVATHEGILVARSNDSYCVGKNGKEYGYGCFVDVVSLDGRIVTRYAHMERTDEHRLNTKHVSRGTPIGTMGNTGYSSDRHLHYEFMTPNVQCLPGADLKLVKVSGEEYVPKTIKYGCLGAADCALSIVN